MSKNWECATYFCYVDTKLASFSFYSLSIVDLNITSSYDMYGLFKFVFPCQTIAYDKVLVRIKKIYITAFIHKTKSLHKTYLSPQTFRDKWRPKKEGKKSMLVSMQSQDGVKVRQHRMYAVSQVGNTILFFLKITWDIEREIEWIKEKIRSHRLFDWKVKCSLFKRIDRFLISFRRINSYKY